MNEDKARFETDPARTRRQTAGLVAQYIHELSQRHAEAREGAPLQAPPAEHHNPEGD